jgi:hypothetical protein
MRRLGRMLTGHDIATDLLHVGSRAPVVRDAEPTGRQLPVIIGTETSSGQFLTRHLSSTSVSSLCRPQGTMAFSTRCAAARPSACSDMRPVRCMGCRSAELQPRRGCREDQRNLHGSRRPLSGRAAVLRTFSCARVCRRQAGGDGRRYPMRRQLRTFPRRAPLLALGYHLGLTLRKDRVYDREKFWGRRKRRLLQGLPGWRASLRNRGEFLRRPGLPSSL